MSDIAEPHRSPVPAEVSDDRAPEWQQPIVVEEPGYVELTPAGRQAAIVVLTEILTAWWQTSSDPAHPGPALRASDSPDETLETDVRGGAPKK